MLLVSSHERSVSTRDDYVLDAWTNAWGPPFTLCLAYPGYVRANTRAIGHDSSFGYIHTADLLGSRLQPLNTLPYYTRISDVDWICAPHAFC
jgi:hypothetical protein